jgi:coenzyme F420-0:L-glutamate ligase / coenzyme F420-1:gamma-L-glutamate ligase
MSITLAALPGMPELAAGDDLGAALAEAAPGDLADGDILVVTSKVVAKAEGRTRDLGEIEPGERARSLAAEHDKDARLVELILRESAELLRAERGVLITETRHGFVCANAGIDASNMPGDDTVVLLPEDPDGSARRLRARIAELRGVRPGVLVTDSFGRAWRLGQTDVAIGAAGISVLDDWRGRRDAQGRELSATVLAAADALAGAADLAREKDTGEPAVLVRGLDRLVTPDDGPGALALRRPREEDLFR